MEDKLTSSSGIIFANILDSMLFDNRNFLKYLVQY